MGYAARSQSKKVTVLRDDHATFIQGERELGFVVPATHPCFSDRHHVDSASTHAMHD
jgi:hypothetical protein